MPTTPWPRPFADKRTAVNFAREASKAEKCKVSVWARKSTVAVDQDTRGFLLNGKRIIESDGQYTEECCVLLAKRVCVDSVRLVASFKRGKEAEWR